MRSPIALTRTLLPAAAFLGISVAATSAANASPELHVDGHHFKDAAGRVVILRGVNAAGDSKVPPFTAMKDATLFDPLATWGMNVVRLLFTWEAYEREPGAYDQAYLDYYANAAKAAWDRGLYVIVDFHQDAFSRYSIGGCGEGFPAWALPASVTPATPDNGPTCANWGTRMITDVDMHTSWTAFHADEAGVKTRYVAMMKSVAQRLDENPGVVGYDIINEPWGDEATELGALYDAGTAAIREASPTAVIFVSPRALTSAGFQTELLPPSFSNAVYSPHFYDGAIVLYHKWSGYPPDEAFGYMTSISTSWDVPMLLGEFGAPAGSTGGARYVDMLYDRLNDGFFSGTQWVYTPGWSEKNKDGWNAEDFSIVDGDGNARDNFRVRPYPRKIAGTPTRLAVSHEKTLADNVVELEWDHAAKIGATELFLSPEAFFGTKSVAVDTEGDDVSCASDGALLTCSSETPGPKKVTLRAGKAPSSSSGPEAEDTTCGLTGVELLLLYPLSRVARRRRSKSRANVLPAGGRRC